MSSPPRPLPQKAWYPLNEGYLQAHRATVSTPILSAGSGWGLCDTGPPMPAEVTSLSMLGSACAGADCLYLVPTNLLGNDTGHAD